MYTAIIGVKGLRATMEYATLSSDVSKLTKIGEYDTYRAGMLMNQRPDGSFMNW